MLLCLHVNRSRCASLLTFLSALGAYAHAAAINLPAFNARIQLHVVRNSHASGAALIDRSVQRALQWCSSQRSEPRSAGAVNTLRCMRWLRMQRCWHTLQSCGGHCDPAQSCRDTSLLRKDRKKQHGGGRKEKGRPCPGEAGRISGDENGVGARAGVKEGLREKSIGNQRFGRSPRLSVVCGGSESSGQDRIRIGIMIHSAILRPESLRPSAPDLKPQVKGEVFHVSEVKGEVFHVSEVKGEVFHVSEVKGEVFHVSEVKGEVFHISEVKGEVFHVSEVKGEVFHISEVKGEVFHISEVKGKFVCPAELELKSRKDADPPSASARNFSINM
ncbi:hypothetical protein KOW79_013521 [Hemibagrus wyckioides]|uniref:Uncharacterized protein n=1 Tax=Hemibagrus wyckioides TaxID=337641 RepID=A0A9D3NL18_9TELE|nr:hypothetical protein KOW79_013521 [Hemibagrus wyckioides]